MDFEQESPKKAWTCWGMGLTEAYGILVLMNIKGKAEVVRNKAGDVAEGNHGASSQPGG